jgi:hypothetical protein
MTASDGTQTASQIFIWTVTNVDRPPVLSAVADRTDAVNATVSLALVATDPDGDVLTFSATGLPGSLSVNPSTGLISGTLSSASAGPHPVTATVFDGTLTTSRTFAWTVTNADRPPVLTAVADRADSVNATVSLALVATDPDGDALTYSVTGLPGGLSVNPSTGLISGTLSSASAGPHAVTATVSDGTLTSRQTFAWTVTNTAPVLTAVGNLSTTTGAAVSMRLAANDPDGDVVTYGVTGPLPPGLSVDPTTGVISGTPSTAGVYSVTVTALDGGLSSSQSFTWTVGPPATGRVKFIQASSSAPPVSGTAVTVRYAAAQTAGHLNVVVVGWRDTTAQVRTVTDTNGNVYQLAVGPTVNPAVGTQAVYYAAGIAAGPPGGTVVTVTFSAPPTGPDVRAAQYDGIDPVQPVDVTAAAHGAGTTSDSGPVPTTFGNDLLIGASLVAAATTTAGTGYTARLVSNPGGNLLEDRVVTTVGTYSAAGGLSPSSAWIMQMVAFRDPNRAPVLTSPGNQFNARETSVSLPLLASDPDGDALTFSAAGLPPSLTIDASTGMISGTLPLTSGGIYSVTATASDGSLTTSKTFTWTITVKRAPTPRDFDGDRKTDITVFRPSTGTWYTRYTGTPTSTALVWGGGTDTPVPADYDGDGLTDIAVFRPSTGTWYIRYSTTPTSAALVWGGGTDIPVPGDYDGDGIADIAVFRPSTGTWYIRYSATSTSAALVWGGGTDIPVPGDYDGDGLTDIAVFRPSTGTWYIRYTGTPTSATFTWGGEGDTPVPADYDGDGKMDIAVFRPSTGTWYIRYSGTPTSAALAWGGGSDIPVRGDFDGDGKADIAVYRPATGTWFIRYTGTPTSAALVWGGGDDIPILKQ